MDPQELKRTRRRRRQLRVRRKVHGTADRPRLAVFRSLKHIYAQIIDDDEGRTLVAASTREPAIGSQLKSCCNKEAATLVGSEIGRRAIQKGIEKVVFDRRHYKYHGRIKALADAAREAGLKF